jgi:hypothetical protein
VAGEGWGDRAVGELEVVVGDARLGEGGGVVGVGVVEAHDGRDAHAGEEPRVVPHRERHLAVLSRGVARPQGALEGEELGAHRVHIPRAGVLERLVPVLAQARPEPGSRRPPRGVGRGAMPRDGRASSAVAVRCAACGGGVGI